MVKETSPYQICDFAKVPRESVKQLRLAVGNAKLVAHVLMPEKPDAIVIGLCDDFERNMGQTHRDLVPYFLDSGVGVIVVQLLTDDERTHRSYLQQDVSFLADRLASILDACKGETPSKNLPLGLFGIGSGGAIVMAAAALRKSEVGAAVVLNLKPHIEFYAGESDLPPTLFVLQSASENEVSKCIRAMELFDSSDKALHIIEESKTKAEQTLPSVATAWYKEHFALR
jgi:hypothetical protein